MKAIGFTVVFLGLLLVSALSGSYAASLIWKWYLTAYGAGPTFGQWYGCSVLLALATSHLKTGWEVKDKDTSDIILHFVGRLAGMWLMIGLSWCVGSILGWVA